MIPPDSIYFQPALWLGAVIIFLAVEAAIPGLVSLWFAIGAAAALIAAGFHASLTVQIICFFAVSTGSLILTRPLAKKFINDRTKPTNADRVLGMECLVFERIDNLMGTGEVNVDGRTWTARMEDSDGTADVGTIVIATRIEGVRLSVAKKIPENKNTKEN